MRYEQNIMYTVTQNFLSILCSYSGQTVKYLETGHPITGIFGRYGKFNIDRYICGPAFFDENEEKRIERCESDEARLSSFFKVKKSYPAFGFTRYNLIHRLYILL